MALDDEKKRQVDEDDLDLDLSAGALDKSNDPVRLYLREMGIVPLLTREGEVAIAKRIERGQIKTRKAITRSPIAVERLLKIGDDLAAGKASIRETVIFAEQAEISVEEDKAEEYLRWTLEGIGTSARTFRRPKVLDPAKKEEALTRRQAGKPGKSFIRLRSADRQSELRLEIAQEIKNLNLTEHSTQLLIASIRKVVEEIRKQESAIKKLE
jgi:RNA polymerase primary sigma factor